MMLTRAFTCLVFLTSITAVRGASAQSAEDEGAERATSAEEVETAAPSSESQRISALPRAQLADLDSPDPAVRLAAVQAQGGGFVAALVGHGMQRRDAGAPGVDERRERRRRERGERRNRERRASITISPTGPAGAGVTILGTFM